ncbi:MAG: site-specific DNA-methyltransferase [Candidatus Acidiferrum sp.]
MPSFNFKGKALVQNFHLLVPYHELKPVKSKSLTAKVSLHDNLVVHGDNLKALKSLLPYYHGKVKCIYIDPPYNTGNEKWVYNDNVSSPMIQEWLGKVVDREDLTRHDKWLCMMMPRLKVLREFLRDDGAIFASIDDNEVHWLRGLMDEVFGEENFVATFMWEKRTTRENRRVFSFNHDYVICYGRSKANFEASRNLLPITEEIRGRYSNPDNDPRGEWQSVSMNAQAGHATEEQFYKIKTPSGRALEPPPGRCWVVTQDRFREMVADNRIWFGADGDNVPREKVFMSETRQGITPHTIWTADEVGTTDSATKDLMDIFSGKSVYETPKPLNLIKRIVQISSGPEDIVLDAFGGSGTTGHAVLALNKSDLAHRRFILIESEDYADGLTAERLRRVVDGVPRAKDEAIRKGLGGSFSFVEMGHPNEVRGNAESREAPVL